MRLKTILVILLIALFVASVGCGKRKNIECHENSDCSQGACHTARCIDNKCHKTYEDDCCGNNRCEDSESRCSCATDCGKCQAPEGVSTNYIKYYCEVDYEYLANIEKFKKELEKQKRIRDRDRETKRKHYLNKRNH